MSGYTHALMQYSHNANAASSDPVNDDVRTNRISQICRRQIIPAMTKLGSVAKSFKRIIDLIAINEKLVFPPCFSRIAQNIDYILSCLWGKFE